LLFNYIYINIFFDLKIILLKKRKIKMKYSLISLVVACAITSFSGYAQSESVAYEDIGLCQSITSFKQKERCDLIKNYLEQDQKNQKVTKLLNYPVIFVHGFLGSYKHFHGNPDSEVYFQGAQELFKPLIKGSDKKQMVFEPSLLSAGSAQDRGEMLINYINAVLAHTGKAKVHLISHSQGAITSRYAAGQMCKQVDVCPIASVASIAGVNYGSTVADYFWKREAEMENQHETLIPEYKSIWRHHLNFKFWNGAGALARGMNRFYEEDPFRTYVRRALKDSDLNNDAKNIYQKMNADSELLNGLRPQSSQKLRSRMKWLDNLISFGSVIYTPVAIHNLVKYSPKRSIEDSIKQLTHPAAIEFNQNFPQGVVGYQSTMDRVDYTEDEMREVHPKHHQFALDQIEPEFIQDNGVFYASWSGYMNHEEYEDNIKLKFRKAIRNSEAFVYKTLRPIFGTTNSEANWDKKYYQNQMRHDGMVANIDSMLGLDFGSYPGFNHSTIINNFSYFFKNQDEYDNSTAHEHGVQAVRQKLDFTNPEYLYLNYISVLSMLEEYNEADFEPK
jgi:pimeloyl-ACP methyl ester carboxylesterase